MNPLYRLQEGDKWKLFSALSILHHALILQSCHIINLEKYQELAGMYITHELQKTKGCSESLRIADQLNFAGGMHQPS